MVGRQEAAFSNCVLHYASGLHGTKLYWFRQHSRLISMVDTIGLPTTHRAADLQWPELACHICLEDPYSRSNCSRAVIEDAVADWFFYHRVQKFIESFYVGVVGATDYWMHFVTSWSRPGLVAQCSICGAPAVIT